MIKVQTYQKKPVEIEAIQLWPTSIDAAYEFAYGKPIDTDEHTLVLDSGRMPIQTFQGIQVAKFGDYIVKSPEGEFYTCNCELFNATYGVKDD